MKKSNGILVVVALSLAAGACGRKPPPPAPEPASNGSSVDRDAEERARREAAERARLEAEERARAEAEERARVAAALTAARTTLAEMVFFDYDEARIKPEAQTILDAKVRILRQYPEARIRIEGHCDERGSNEYNDALGSRRALSVQSYLAGAGIAAGRMEIISFGEDRPMASGQNEAAWSRNRRAEFRILAGLGG